MTTPKGSTTSNGSRRPQLCRNSRSDPCQPTRLRRAQLSSMRETGSLPSRSEDNTREGLFSLPIRVQRPSALRRYVSEDGCIDHGEGPSGLDQSQESPTSGCWTPAELLQMTVPSHLPVRRSHSHNDDPSLLFPAIATSDAQSRSCSPFATMATSGDVEDNHLHRSSSYEVSCDKASRKPLVRFESRQEMQQHCADSNPPRPGQVHRLSPIQTGSPFTNPFAVGSEDTSRTTSSSSDVASYLRADAFAGHRDTLARFRPESNQCDRSASDTDSQSSIDETDLMSLQAFARHRDTFARIEFERRTVPCVPNQVMGTLLQFLPIQDYCNLRLTCRQWCQALPRPRAPAIHRLPQEMLRLIFSFQEPGDFDAARHTCREWFTASLDFSLLCGMLRAMQCQHA
jgi:hypothetical protein